MSEMRRQAEHTASLNSMLMEQLNRIEQVGTASNRSVPHRTGLYRIEQVCTASNRSEQVCRRLNWIEQVCRQLNWIEKVCRYRNGLNRFVDS